MFATAQQVKFLKGNRKETQREHLNYGRDLKVKVLIVILQQQNVAGELP